MERTTGRLRGWWTVQPIDGSVRISSRIKSGGNRWISSLKKKLNLNIFRVFCLENSTFAKLPCRDPTWSPKWLEVTFSTSGPEGRSLTVKHPKAKVTTLKNLGFPTFLCNASWILEPTNRRKSVGLVNLIRRMSFPPDFWGIFGPESGWIHQKGHLANG